MNIEILFRDDEWVFVHKPSGVLVHRSVEAGDKLTLMQYVRDHLGCHVYAVNRLDRGASGIVAFALSPKSAADLQKVMSEVTTQKTYICLTRGIVPDRMLIDKPLSTESGKLQSARTELEALAKGPYCSLVKVRILTGRRHQIRRHLSYIKHHILGDRIYGKGRLNELYRTRYHLDRLFLHAAHLSFYKNGQMIEVISTLPQELCESLKLMEKDNILNLKGIGCEDILRNSQYGKRA